MWPFKKKDSTKSITGECVKCGSVCCEDGNCHPKEEQGITLYASDDGMVRARYAMTQAGFVINNNLHNQLPWIAQVFDGYKELDRKEALREAAKKKKKKGGK